MEAIKDMLMFRRIEEITLTELNGIIEGKDSCSWPQNFGI